jgi:hypothetical protein
LEEEREAWECVGGDGAGMERAVLHFRGVEVEKKTKTSKA